MNNLILLAGQMHNDEHTNGPITGIGGIVLVVVIIWLLSAGGGSKGGKG